jgi:hypothetical protein
LSEGHLKNSNSSRLKLFLAVVGIFTPAGYLIGLSFYQGTFIAYGISKSTDVFPISVQEVYVTAYYAISYLFMGISSLIIKVFTSLFSAPTIYWSLSFIALLVAILYLTFKRPPFLKNWLPKWLINLVQKSIYYLHWDNNNLTKVVGIISALSYLILSLIYIILAISLFWVFTPWVASYKGQEVAEEKRDKYLEKGCFYEKDSLWSNCMSLKSKDGKTICKGILIAHTKEHVAFFNSKGTVIVKIPIDSTIVNELSKKYNKKINSDHK